MVRRDVVLSAVVGLLALILLWVVPVTAQQVEIHATPPDQVRPEIVPPPLLRRTTRPQQADDYPQGMLVPYDPAFIEPLAATWDSPTSSGAFGLSGYTAPNQPVGSIQSANRVVNGYMAFGFTFTWGGPPKRPQAPAAP